MSATDTVAQLYPRMEAAAARLDFEEAKLLRDRINLIRNGAKPQDAAAADTSGLIRQQPGNMGIGSSVPTPVTPDDWVAPPKPDPMTRATGRRRAS